MNQHHIRQNILRRLQECNPAPARAVELSRAMPLVGLTPLQKQELITTEATILCTFGMIENLKAQNPLTVPYYRITAAGLAQITQETDKLEEVVWGDLAY